MKKRLHILPRVLIVLLTMSVLLSTGATAASRYSVATGNWNATSTWSATSGGAAGASVPVAGDAVTIEGGHNVTLTADAACATVTFTTATATSLTLGTYTLNVSGAITIPRAGSNVNLIAVGAGTLNADSVAFTSGGVTMRHEITISTGTVTVTGDVTQAGSTGSATIAFTDAGLLNLGGAFLTSATGTLTVATGCTVAYNAAGAQTVGDFTYNNLTLSGSGAKTTTGATVNGILSMEGTATTTGTVATYGAAATLQYKGTGTQTTGTEFPATWSGTGGVIIANTSGNAVALNAAKVVNASLTINNGATLATGNFQLTFGGNFVNNGTFTAGSSNIVISGTGTQSIAGFTTTGGVTCSKSAGVATLTGNMNAGSLTNSTAGGTLNLGIGLTHTITGAWTRTNGTLDGNSSTLNIGGTVTNTAGAFTAGTSTVNYNGTVAQTIATVNYNNLGFSGAHTTNSITINGAVGIAGAITNTATFSSGNFVLAGSTITYNGTGAQTVVSLNGVSYATLAINKASGTATLGSAVTATAFNNTAGTFDASTFLLTATTPTLTAGTLRVGGATWATNYSFTPTPAAGFTIEYYNANPTINGAITYQNLQFSGTGTAGASATLIVQGDLTNTGGGALNFGANNVTLSGTVAANNIAGFTTSGTVSCTKTSGTATFTGNVSAGPLSQTGAGGTLNLGVSLTHSCTNLTVSAGTLNGGSSTLNVSGNVTTGGTFTASTGTINYNGAAQTCGVWTYNNLTLSGSGIKTFATTPTVNGVLSMEGTATVTVTAGVVTYGASATLQYNTATARTSSPEEWISPFTGTGGVIIANTGTITLDAVKTFNASAPLTINSGATLATGNFQLTFGGNFVSNGGTLTAGSSPIVIANTMATQSIAGFTTTGLVSMTKTGGTATFTGNVNGAGLTINGTGGTLNLGSGLTHTFTGVVTLTAGTLNGGSSTLNENMVSATAWNGNGGLFSAGTGTVNFGAAGNQTLSATTTTFNNLTLSNSGAKTFTNGNTVNGILSMEGTATVTLTGALNYGANATLQYNTATARTAAAEWANTFAATGGVIIANTGAITMNAAKVFNASVPLTINSGATLNTSAANNWSLTFGGDFNNNSGTFTANASPIVITYTAATQSIDGFTTTGTVSMTKTAGTATFTGNVNGAGLTINGAGGTLNLGISLTHSVSSMTFSNGTLNLGSSTINVAGAVTLTTGTLNLGSGTLNLTGNFSGAGTLTGSTGTMNFNGSSAQTAVGKTTYNIVKINNAAGVTLTSAATIATLTIGDVTANSVFNDGGFVITPGASSVLNLTGGTYNLGSATVGNAWPAWVTRNITAGTTVGYVSGVAQAVSITPSYQNLTYSGAGAKTVAAGGTLSVAGNWAVGSAATITTANATVTGNITGSGAITMGSDTITIGGNWTNSGTFTPGTSQVIYNGNYAGQIVGGGITYYNLQISNGGTKLLQGGAATVSNVLTLNSGIFDIGNYNLILSNTAAGAIAGTYSTSSMVQTSGTGYLQKAGAAAGSGINIVYPVGAGGFYNPLDLTGGFTAASGTGNLQISATTANQGDNALSKYWTLNVSGYAGITAKLRFTYDNAEVHGTQSAYDTWYYSGVWGLAPGTHTAIGADPFGTDVSGVTAASISGKWSAGATRFYYSYQSGEWTDSTSWTTDRSGTLWLNPAVPGTADNVTILNGRTISISTNNKQVASLTISQGAILDIHATTGHNFGAITGQGKMMLNSNTLPGGTYTSFVASNGGTIEYYNLNNVSITATQFTYNNLIVSNYSTNSNSAFLNNSANPTNYVINGNFSLKNYLSGSQTFYFGNPTPSDNLINMTVYGDFSVDAGCNIMVNNFAIPHTIPSDTASILPYPIHTLSLYGNLTNNGSIRFTGLLSPVANAYYTLTTTASGGTNYGDVQVFFYGATNNAVTCNGTTDFFRLIVAKGTDETYTLEVNSSNTSNFALYAPNYQGSNVFDGGPEHFGFGAYYKALFIHYGTLKLNENINIPSLTEGGQDFNVLPTAGLWINGANVSTTVIGFPTSTSTDYQAATLYGSLQISAGQFSTGNSAGIVLGTLGTPVIAIEGTGTLDVSQAWVANGTTNLMSYIQTGGTANIRMQGENHAGPMLGLDNPNASFVMTGGVMNFTDNAFVGTTGNDYQIMNIRSQVGNYQVTGGTINLNLPSSATVYTANSTVPFYNLNISRRTGGATTTIQWDTSGSSLNILHDLTIGDNTVLDLATDSIDLAVGHNFTISSLGTYTPGTRLTNTTTFNGAGAQAFNNVGAITGGALNNLTVTNSSVTSIINNNVTVNRTLLIDQNAVLNDSGKYVYALGNIINNGRHTGLLASGGIRLNGTAAQTIDGNGTGIFNNLIISKPNTTGVSLIADASIAGNLRLVTNPNLNIGPNSLAFGTKANVYTDSVATTQNFDSLHMIVTNGLASDGGVSKAFDSLKTFFYPIGTGTKYRPAQIQLTKAPAQYGSVTIRPIPSPNPLIQVAGKAINLYWKTTSSGFSGIQSGGINQVYYYYRSDSPTPTDEPTYVPGAYIIPNWVTNNSVDSVLETLTPRQIHFGSINYIDGEFTCGTAAAFSGLTTYYSNSNNLHIATGVDWNADSTWCTGSNTGTPALALPDNKGNAVFIIGDGSSTVHKINISGSHHIQAGNMLIMGDGVLDIGSTNGHNFGAIPNTKITGTGKLRIASTNYFPTADWGDFLGAAGGTVEYYQTSTGVTLQMPATYSLPAGGVDTILTYYNLITSPYSGSNVILPNTNLTIFKDLTVGYSGVSTSNCITQVNAGASSTTVEVNGTININQFGVLQYMNNVAENVVSDNDINIASGGALQVRNGGTASIANTLTVNGNIVNNGTLDLDPNYPTNDNFRCSLIFTGLLSKSLTSTTTPVRTRLYSVIVNKGTVRDSVVDVSVDTTGFRMGGGGLTLQNGTFRLSKNVIMPLSSGGFTIPTTGCLSANGGTFNIATGAAAADLTLNGRLEVLAGAVNVGPAIASASANAFNIVYAPAGAPEITVSGGVLNVYSQIRRGAVNTSGSLNYTQTAGVVTVGGKNANTSRGAFEVLNSGSKFVMGNGTLIIATHITAASPYDLDIEPDVENVTGGTIQLGLSGVTANNTAFTFQSSSTLGNLTLEATSNSSAIQQIYALSLLGNLTIGGSSSYYSANGLDLEIGGNLTNNNTSASVGLNVGGFQAQALTQSTSFLGSADQSLTGTTSNLTNFANLEIATAQGQTMFLSGTTSNIAVNGNLTLTSGTFNDGGSTVKLVNNVDNDAVHVSPSATSGGMVFIGTTNQGMTGSGYGVFGNIEINNGGKGVNMTDNSTINGQLKFTNGFLYIDNYLLTLGQSATIAGTLNASNLILLNGVLSDEGVKKTFPTGAASFTFPIGDNGKYTPCTYNFASNSNAAGATIKVVPVDQLHPSIVPALYNNYLNYYWNVVTTGFSSAYSVTHTYTYNPADTTGTPANIERCDNATSQWTTVAGTITPPTFSFNSTSLLDGGYTIGDHFVSLPLLYSIKSGSWSDPSVWDTSNVYTGYNHVPNGNPVMIQLGDTVVLSANGSYAASVLINGVLDAQNTTFHNLGQVSGTGKLKLYGTSSGSYVFPGGSYDGFFANPSSTIEFYGNNNSTLPSNPGDIYKPYQNVILSGTGIKYISSINMKINGNLTFSPGSKLDNTLNNKDIIILGSWIDQNTGTAGFAAGTGTVRFNGSAAQSIAMANGSMKETFYNLAISNTAGLTISTGNVDVANQLYLTAGNITTSSSNNLTINNTNTNAVVGGSISSFVNGPLRKKINNGSSFQFPVGDATSSGRNRFGYVSVNSTATSGAQIWTAQFIDKNPTANGDSTSKLNAPLHSIFSNEYWNIIGPTSGSANVVLSWDQYTGMSSSPSDRAQSMVAEWNTPVSSSWNSVGQVVTDLGQNSGTVATSTLVSLENHIFAIGSTIFPQVSALISAVQSGVWSNPAVWDIGRVPGPNDSVVINSPYSITLDFATGVVQLVLKSGATYNDSTFTLTVTGNLVVSGTWKGAGKISMTTDGDSLLGSGSVAGTSVLEIAGNKTIASAVNLTLKNVSILGGKTLKNNGIVTINDLTGATNSTFVNASGSTLVINGQLLSTGILDASTCPNTVTYNGSGSQSVKAGTYCNLTIQNGGTKTADGSITVNNVLTNTATFDLSTYSLSTVASSSIINSGATIQTAGSVSFGAVHVIDGTFIYQATTGTQSIGAASYATLTLSGGSGATGQKNFPVGTVSIRSAYTVGGADRNYGTGTFAYAGILAQNVLGGSAENYYNLSVSGAADTSVHKTVTVGNLYVQNNFTIAASNTIDMNSYSFNALPAGTTSNLGKIRWQGSNVFIGGTGTTEFYGSSLTTVALGLTYGNILFTGSGTMTIPAGNVTATGGDSAIGVYVYSNLTVANGGVLTVTGMQFNAAGQITNNGTIFVGP